MNAVETFRWNVFEAESLYLIFGFESWEEVLSGWKGLLECVFILGFKCFYVSKK